MLYTPIFSSIYSENFLSRIIIMNIFSEIMQIESFFIIGNMSIIYNKYHYYILKENRKTGQKFPSIIKLQLNHQLGYPFQEK